MMVRTKQTAVAKKTQRRADDDDGAGGEVRAMLETNDWAPAINHQRDGPLSWKHYAVLLLRNVSVDEVAAQLMPVLGDMARQVEDAITDAYEARTPDSDGVTIEEWLLVWNDHFRHWTDPVREMLKQFAVTTDTEHFVAVAMRSNPVVLLDFLLDAIVAHGQRLSLYQMLRGEVRELPWIYSLRDDHPKAATALEALCLRLYAQFAARSPLDVGVIPENVDTGLDDYKISDEVF
jgi:hypothetical protein